MKPYFKLTLLFQLFLASTVGQIPKSKYFTSKDGFCSTTFFIDNLGNFYREGGCEGRSRISLGTYKLTSEKIHFMFQKFDSLPPIYSIEAGRSSTDSSISVTLLTRQRTPIPNRHFSVDAIDTSGKFFKTLRLDDSGQVNVDHKKYKELRLDYLENIYRRKIRIPISNKDLTIVLNFPQLFFYYSNPRPRKESNFSLTIKADGLYDLTGKQRLFATDD